MSEESSQQVDLYARDAESFREPPRTLGAMMGWLGPGLILVGSIVGSGELIMTTKLGAQAGMVRILRRKRHIGGRVFVHLRIQICTPHVDEADLSPSLGGWAEVRLPTWQRGHCHGEDGLE